MNFVDSFAKSVLNYGGSIHPLIINSKLNNGLGLMNPSIFIDNGKIIVNLRAVNYTFYHSEEKLFQTKKSISKQLNPLFKVTQLVKIDFLPRTASNKVMRRKLREIYDNF